MAHVRRRFPGAEKAVGGFCAAWSARLRTRSWSAEDITAVERPSPTERVARTERVGGAAKPRKRTLHTDVKMSPSQLTIHGPNGISWTPDPDFPGLASASDVDLTRSSFDAGHEV